jgi:hypothetical protein
MDLEVTGALFETFERPKPFVVNWSRLEALSVTPVLEEGLQARIADPLWMLGRQWQFNEFQGEDAGSPIEARLTLEQASIDRLRLGTTGRRPSDGVSDFAPLQAPLEVVVEAEPDPRVNLRLVAEAGLQLMRRLRVANLTTAAKRIAAAFPLALPTTEPSDGVAETWWALFAGRAVDALAVVGRLEPLAQSDGTLSGLPAIPGWTPPPSQATPLRQALASWFADYRASLVPGSAHSAWLPERLEYTFAARAELADGRTVLLDAAEYSDGRLDWHRFVLADDPGLGDPSRRLPASIAKPSPKLPAPVRYPGMPADRYWEIEDGAVTFGRASAGPTELMRMMLIEFALVYGNDWFLVPFDVPVGSLVAITSLVVRDTFGVETEVRPARDSGGRPFRLFELTDRSAQPRSWFFLPPTLPARLEGDSLEEVALFRDEMANMAWAVERRVPSVASGAIDRSQEPYSTLLHQEVEGGAIDAEMVYRLQTDVPARWIPLVPVVQALPGTTATAQWLERRAMIRTQADGSRVAIQPKGLLLRTDPAHAPEDEPALRLAEEEVPREGAVVRRSFQYARWMDGTSYLWLGRDKTTGRGEGSSDLRFDVLVRHR